MTKNRLIGYVIALTLLLGAILCAAPYPIQAQADPTILARQAELAATAQIVRATNEAAARERAKIAAEAAAEAERMRAEAEATAIVINAQNTAAAMQATSMAIMAQTATAGAMARATGTAQATQTQIAGTATAAVATATAAPIRTAEALAYRATVQAQEAEDLQKNVRLGAWVVGIALLMGAAVVGLALMVRYTMSIRLAKPVVIEVAPCGESPAAGDEEVEGANVTDDQGFASVIVNNVAESLEREAAQ